jgi:carboxypeptidase C (cathepsin A)
MSTGPNEAKGFSEAAKDMVHYGENFAEAFVEATADFEDWFLTGYRSLVYPRR